MILNKITLNNFRQFYGEQVMEFSQGEKNITIVLGENGTGKTGIFRALLFSLFGEVHIGQDNKDDSLHIVNFKAIQESQGLPTKCSVTIEFESNKAQYALTRSYVASLRNNSIIEREDGVSLTQIDIDGNYSPEPIMDEHEIHRIVSAIVDKNTKDFFFFDGEQIETLAKTDEEVKKEVKNGIVKLLKIDEIEAAITVLGELSRNEKAKITREAKNLDLTKKQQEAEAIENAINNLTELTIQRKQEVIILKNKIKELEFNLNQSNEINDLIEQKGQIKDKINLQKQLASSKKDGVRKILLENGSNFLLSDHYIDVNNYLNQIAADQKDLVSITAINKSINDMECVICGTDLSKNENHYHHVESLKENFKSDELTPLISLIQGAIEDFTRSENEFESEMQNALMEFNEVRNNIEKENIKLDNLDTDIKDVASSEVNLSNLQSDLDNKKEELEALVRRIDSDEKNIEQKEKEKTAVNKEFEALLSQNESLKTDQKVLLFINDLRSEMNTIFDEYSDDMRLRLSNETTNIFKTLISEKDRDLINRININEKYEIEVIAWDDINITPDISQGQRQIVSLAFITALSKVAMSAFKNNNFPLFMDTPFGRISGENRDQLIENIPLLTSQWILLLTDTELTASEEIAFKATDKLGIWYQLNQIEKGYTIIEKIDVTESIATRG